MRRALYIAETVLSLGLNRVIARLGLNPRWRGLLWAVIALNEARGVAVAWQAAKVIF